MTNQHPPDAGPWDDDEDDDEQTQVAPHPMLRGATPPSATTPVSGLLTRRNVSSFGPPARAAGHGPADRRSLYDRLLESGALDDVMAIAAEESAPQPLQLSSIDRKPASNDAGLADLADALEPARDSGLELRDSDLQLVAQRDSDGFVSALSRDPEGEEPVVLGKPSKGAALPPPPARPPLPSVVLGPQLSTRYDATERVSIPRTHPLANSLAPAASIKSAPPAAAPRSTGWLVGVAAAALVGLGAVGLATQRGADRGDEEPARSAATAPVAQVRLPQEIAPAPKVETPVVAVAPVQPPAPPVEAAKVAEPAAPEASSGPAQKASASDESRRETADEHAERSHHHHRRSRDGSTGTDAPKADAAAESPSPKAERATVTAPAPAKSDKSDASLPAQPSRDQVVAAMGGVLPQLQECVGDKHGATTVTVTVRSAGFVSYAIVGGAFAGTAEGSCIARVVKEASFPAFSDPFVRITYPYQL